MQLNALVARQELESYIGKTDGKARQSTTLSLLDTDTVSPLNHLIDYQLRPEEVEALGARNLQGQKVVINIREFGTFGNRIRIRGAIVGLEAGTSKAKG